MPNIIYERPEWLDPGNQAPGAIPNGSRIIKVNSEKGDVNPNGALGTVVASIGVPESVRAMVAPTVPAIFRNETFGYLIRWDGLPLQGFIMGSKIERAPK